MEACPWHMGNLRHQILNDLAQLMTALFQELVGKGGENS